MAVKNEDFRLRVFLTLAELGSFTETASVLGVSQPAVSQNVAELERIYGLKLILRSRNGLSLTEDGRAFLLYARNIIAAYAAASAFASKAASAPAVPAQSPAGIDGRSLAVSLIAGILPALRILDAEIADEIADGLGSIDF